MSPGRVVPRRGGGSPGFSLGEALVAVLLFGLVATLLYRTLVGGQRIHRAHLQEAAMGESTRAALAILAAEFRELSARDGDILAMDSSSITYNAMRALYLLCAAPDTAAAAVLLDGVPVYGATPLAAPGDSILVFAEGDPFTRLDDTWLSAGTVSAAAGADCPGGRASLAVHVAGVAASRLAGVLEGAPVRTFRPVALLTYQDASRDWWMGQRQFQAASGTWSVVQPVLGPLSPGGLVLTYVDSAGGRAGFAGDVSRVGIRVEARSPERVHRTTGAAYLARSLATQVALRNNRRY